MNAEIKSDIYKSYLGRTQVESDLITAAPIDGLSALLDKNPPRLENGAAIPSGAHWLYFLPFAKQSNIDLDGHPRRGDFLPSIPHPRRMWAGSRIRFDRTLQIGQNVERASKILSVQDKDGRSGKMTFITLQHTYSSVDGTTVTEEQDIVYREAPVASAASMKRKSEPVELPVPLFKKTVRMSEVALFRFSALTFNSHRIHYDRQYAVESEGYPDLVVHGPLTATLLLHFFQECFPASFIREFAFRGLQPLFVSESFDLTINAVSEVDYVLSAVKNDGSVAMRAEART